MQAGKVLIFYFFAITGGKCDPKHVANVKEVAEFIEAMGPTRMQDPNYLVIHTSTFHASPSNSDPAQYVDKMVRSRRAWPATSP